MRHRETNAAPAPRGRSGSRPLRRLSPAALRALAEEAAVHAETGLAMAGLDGFEACVEPVPAPCDDPGLRVAFRDEEGTGLCAFLQVAPDGRVRARIEGEAAWRAAPGPWRATGDLARVAGDAAFLLRAGVTGVRLS